MRGAPEKWAAITEVRFPGRAEAIAGFAGYFGSADADRGRSRSRPDAAAKVWPTNAACREEIFPAGPEFGLVADLAG